MEAKDFIRGMGGGAKKQMWDFPSDYECPDCVKPLYKVELNIMHTREDGTRFNKLMCKECKLSFYREIDKLDEHGRSKLTRRSDLCSGEANASS